MLVQLTQYLDFFVKINQKKFNQETHLAEKICRRMKYETFSKGETVIDYGKLNFNTYLLTNHLFPTQSQGAKADKFFIILSGQVSIFLVKSPETIDEEAARQRIIGRATNKLDEEHLSANNSSSAEHRA